MKLVVGLQPFVSVRDNRVLGCERNTDSNHKKVERREGGEREKTREKGK